MNIFPASLSLEILESQHSEYTEQCSLYRTINLLYEGGYLLAAHKDEFLPQRPGEPNDIYQQRIKKFTYTNVLSSSINHQASKLTASSYTVSGVDTNDGFWKEFRENVNKAGLNEVDFIGKLFREALLYKSVFVQVDKPYLAVKPRNRKDERVIGARPYLVTHNPSSVINWNDEDRILRWVKIRQISEDNSNPLSLPRTRCEWTFITDTTIAKYASYVKLGKNNQIIALIDSNGKEIPVTAESTVPLIAEPIEHGFGEIPVKQMVFPSDLWVANQIYLKCLEFLNLENIRYDSASVMTYIQRTYKPYRPPDTDLSTTYEDDDEEEVHSGNPYIIKADSFEFKEMTGTSLTVLQNILDKLEAQIREAIALGGASATQQAIQQSGVSKAMDFVVQELVLRAYGAIIAGFYQDILQLVSKAVGNTDGQKISVSGFNDFSLDSLNDLLLIATEIEKIKANLPETVLKLFYKNFAGLLVRNASAEETQQINNEIDSINYLATGQADKPETLPQSA